MATATKFARKDLRPLLEKFRKGQISKTEAERQLGIQGHRGKTFTRAIESVYGLDTRFGQVKPLEV